MSSSCEQARTEGGRKGRKPPGPVLSKGARNGPKSKCYKLLICPTKILSSCKKRIRTFGGLLFLSKTIDCKLLAVTVNTINHVHVNVEM